MVGWEQTGKIRSHTGSVVPLYVALIPSSLLKLTGSSTREGLNFGFSLTHITREGS